MEENVEQSQEWSTLGMIQLNWRWKRTGGEEKAKEEDDDEETEMYLCQEQIRTQEQPKVIKRWSWALTAGQIVLLLTCPSTVSPLGTVFVALFLTAVDTAICGVHMQICTGSVPTSLTLLFWRWLTVSSVFRVWAQAWAVHRNPLPPSPSLSPAVSNKPYVASVLFGSGTEKQNHKEWKQFVT